MNSFKPYSFLFAIVFVANLYGLYTESASLVYFFKPLITIVLMVGLMAVTNLEGKFKKRIFAGLIFGLLGDVFLMLQERNPSFFMYGLVAFLTGHLFYITAFHLDIRSDPDKKNKYFLWTAIVLIVFCGSVFRYMQPALGDLQIPVLVYSFLLTVMVILSVGRYGKVNIYSFRLVALGAFLFMFSDLSLAYDKFIRPVPNAGYVTMASYMLAQYLIVYGTVTRNLLVKSRSA